MVAIVAVLGVATLALMVGWGLKVIHEIEDLENLETLSARVVGPAAELRPAWIAAGDGNTRRPRNVHLFGVDDAASFGGGIVHPTFTSQAAS